MTGSNIAVAKHSRTGWEIRVDLANPHSLPPDIAREESFVALDCVVRGAVQGMFGLAGILLAGLRPGPESVDAVAKALNEMMADHMKIALEEMHGDKEGEPDA